MIGPHRINDSTRVGLTAYPPSRTQAGAASAENPAGSPPNTEGGSSADTTSVTTREDESTEPT